MGLAALRGLLAPNIGQVPVNTASPVSSDKTPELFAEPLSHLADALSVAGHGLIMVMGKGGVGKTTIAAALATGLVQRGHTVHLTTTDPAAHLDMTLHGNLPGLRVDRVDPKSETRKYIDKVMASKAAGLDAQEQALMLEDLQSPCTEEVAVFHAFSRVVSEARSAYVVLDTAPTGHSLLLMDTTGAYHRQMLREYGDKTNAHLVTPLMRLQDPQHTQIILVTLPEVTPVSQASALQDDLRRAQIEPYAWVVNKSIAASGTSDPMLGDCSVGERRQLPRIAAGLSKKTFVVPWLAEPPVGIDALSRLTAIPAIPATSA